MNILAPYSGFAPQLGDNSAGLVAERPAAFLLRLAVIPGILTFVVSFHHK